MKKSLLAIVIVLGVLVPSFASADSYGVEPTLGQLLTRIAALQALISHEEINCAVTATKSAVKVGEVFTIAWGSYGADAKYSNDPQNAYPQNGEQTMRITTPEVRTYHFTFYGPNGLKKTCDQTISVSA
jgi:hypothetical protein